MQTNSIPNCFDPKLTLSPWPEVAVEVYPPRVHAPGGLGTAHWSGDAPREWTTTCGPVTVRCRWVERERGAEMEMCVANDGPDQEVAIRYPVVYYRFPEGTPLREFDPLFGGVLEKRSLWVERWYPGDASLCASFVAAPDRTLGMAVRDEAQRRIRIYHLPGDVNGQMSFELERVWVRRGETIVLPSAYVAWGRDWGDVLRPYRDWITSTYRRPQPLSRWYWEGNWVETRYAHCLAPVHPTKSTAAGAWVFDNNRTPQTLPQLEGEMNEAFRVLGARGLKPLFYQFGWWRAMERCPGLFLFDAVSGDYAEGGHPLIKPAIEYSHRHGGRTFVYTNFISAGEDSRLYREHPELFARDRNGFPIRNASYPMFVFCPGAPGLREFWDRTLRTILLDLDADGLFLDQVGGGTPTAYCYDPAHRHDHPDVYGRDYLALLDWVCRRAREIKPDCFIGGELTSDIRALWCDQMQGVGYSRPQELKNLTPATPPNEHFAFMSFINPEITHLPAGPEYVARGCPGQPDNALWQKYRDVFRAGLQPCAADPVAATAYLFGPVNGQAILATLAALELPDVRVTLPVDLKPAPGGTAEAQPAGPRTVRVAAGPEPRFYRLLNG